MENSAQKKKREREKKANSRVKGEQSVGWNTTYVHYYATLRFVKENSIVLDIRQPFSGAKTFMIIIFQSNFEAGMRIYFLLRLLVAAELQLLLAATRRRCESASPPAAPGEIL